MDSGLAPSARPGMTARWSLHHAHHRFDLHGDLAGQRAHADGGAGVAAALAEHGNEQIGAAVDDLQDPSLLTGEVSPEAKRRVTTGVPIQFK